MKFIEKYILMLLLCVVVLPTGVYSQKVVPDEQVPMPWLVINKTDVDMLVSIIRAEKAVCRPNYIGSGSFPDFNLHVPAHESGMINFLPDMVGVPFHVFISSRDDIFPPTFGCNIILSRGKNDWMELQVDEDGLISPYMNPQYAKPDA